MDNTHITNFVETLKKSQDFNKEVLLKILEILLEATVFPCDNIFENLDKFDAPIQLQVLKLLNLYDNEFDFDLVKSIDNALCNPKNKINQCVLVRALENHKDSRAEKLLLSITQNHTDATLVEIATDVLKITFEKEKK